MKRSGRSRALEPDRITWIRPRDAWAIDRACVQPLERVGTVMEFQSRYIEAAAEAQSGADFALRLEGKGFVRLDPDVEPAIFRARR